MLVTFARGEQPSVYTIKYLSGLKPWEDNHGNIIDREAEKIAQEKISFLLGEIHAHSQAADPCERIELQRQRIFSRKWVNRVNLLSSINYCHNILYFN